MRSARPPPVGQCRVFVLELFFRASDVVVRITWGVFIITISIIGLFRFDASYPGRYFIHRVIL